MYIRICVYVLKRFSMLLRFDKKNRPNPLKPCVNEWKHILSYFSPLCMLWCVWLVGSFIWLVGCIGGLVGQLVGWFGWVDWLAGWLGLVGWIVACLFAWLIACLLVDWLIGWLVGCGVVDLILFVSALRVPRAVTRLTVYRAPQHFERKWNRPRIHRFDHCNMEFALK